MAKSTKIERTTDIEARIPIEYHISYWYTKDQEMPEHEAEHVREMLEEGYTSGELLDEGRNGNINHGWWEVIKEA